MKELATALVAAQAEIENASKDSANPFFKSKYADLNSVMGAIKPALAKHGLAFTQVCHDADSAAKIETVIWHKSGEHVSCGTISVPVSKHDAQGYGSALTYARRYSLSAAFGVGAEDDDGNAAAKAAPKKSVTIKPTDGAGEALTLERKNELSDLAIAVREAEAADAVVMLDEAGLDVDEKVFVWSLLDSKVRSAIKRAQAAMMMGTQA